MHRDTRTRPPHAHAHAHRRTRALTPTEERSVCRSAAPSAHALASSPPRRLSAPHWTGQPCCVRPRATCRSRAQARSWPAHCATACSLARVTRAGAYSTGLRRARALRSSSWEFRAMPRGCLRRLLLRDSARARGSSQCQWSSGSLPFDDSAGTVTPARSESCQRQCVHSDSSRPSWPGPRGLTGRLWACKRSLPRWGLCGASDLECPPNFSGSALEQPLGW